MRNVCKNIYRVNVFHAGRRIVVENKDIIFVKEDDFYICPGGKYFVIL